MGVSHVDLQDDTDYGDDYGVNSLHGMSSIVTVQKGRPRVPLRIQGIYTVTSIEYPSILGSFAGQGPSSSIGYGQRFPSSRRSDTVVQAPYRKNSV
jgi:hypothetical protein